MQAELEPPIRRAMPPKCFEFLYKSNEALFFLGLVSYFSIHSLKKTKIVPKYKHNHIIDDDSSSTFDFRTVNVKEKCTLSPS